MKTNQTINDISRCVERGLELSRSIANIRRKEHRVYRAFRSLANDDLAGAIAFGIWRERGRLLSSKV